MTDWKTEAWKFAPGVTGSLVSLLFIKAPPLRRIALFLSGVALAWFGTSTVCVYSGLEPGPAGFGLGLFGMSVVSRAFDMWESLQLTAIVQEWIRQKLGLPSNGGQP